MNKFQFNPPSGLLDTSAYPTNPATEAEARGQIQDPLNQIKNYLILLLDDFVFSKETNGYKKLPNGFIEQWGEIVLTGTQAQSNNAYPNFPIAFPNECLHIEGNASPRDVNTNTVSCSFYIEKNTNGNFHYRLGGATSSSTTKIQWKAIGY